MVDWSHIKALDRARLVQFEHSSVLHWSMNGQGQLLKCAEKDEVVIMADFVRRVLGRPSSSRAQVALEEELGACIPTVFKGNIVYFFCNAVRIWRDHDDGILHTPQPVRTRITL